MPAQYYEEGPPADGRKVMLAVPTYESPDTSLTFALARAREALTAAGIGSALLILEGNCHVDDARNAICRTFMESDCTELMFLDADVTFEPEDLVQLCGRDVDIVGGVYPFRREGQSHMPVRLLEDGEVVDGLREVEGLPTGFMKIKREVLARMAAERPWFFDKIYPTPLLFDRPLPDEEHIRWGGDLDFCRRWRAMGGKIYADEEIRLGHAAKVVIYDSLAAHLRRTMGGTLPHLVQRLKDGTETGRDYHEAFRFVENPYAADAMVLALVVGIARKCAGPILETGSGLSSVLMAAVTDQPVYSLEYDVNWGMRTIEWAEQAGVPNVGLCKAPLGEDGWYELDGLDLPGKFAFGFCDGPPRKYGSRMRFFEVFAERCTVIVVDDFKSDNNFAKAVHDWAASRGRLITVLGRAALIQKG